LKLSESTDKKSWNAIHWLKFNLFVKLK
jgi:hypothetical protein